MVRYILRPFLCNNTSTVGRSIFAEDLQPIPEHVCHKDDVAETASSAPPAQTAEEEEELEQEEVVEEAIIPRSPKMDTHGKPIGRLNLNNSPV